MAVISLADRIEEVLVQNGRPAPLRWLSREVQAPEGAVHNALKLDDRFLGLPDGLWTTRNYGHLVAAIVLERLGGRIFGPRDLRIDLGIARKEVMPLLDWLKAKRWVEKVEEGYQWIGPDSVPSLEVPGAPDHEEEGGDVEASDEPGRD